jgi:hypothetical protein
MNTHPYLRAYLAGIFVPTFVLPLLLTVFIVVRLVLKAPVPIEQALIFPMAVVPTIWGLWNMLYLGSLARAQMPIGLFGAALPLLMMPVGAWVGSCLGVLALGSNGVTCFQTYQVPYALFAIVFLAGLAGYYLLWKYIVGFLNRVLGIA